MTAEEAQTLVAGAKRFGVELERSAVERLDRFFAVLAVWNRRIRLTGERDLRLVIEQHAVDSLAPLPYLPSTGLVVDLGSGAGFPGIVLGCIRPDLELCLIEPRRRRTSFLREAIRSIPLPRARALEMRGEEAAHDPALANRAALVTARAIRVDVLLELAAPLLASDGELVAMQTPRAAALAERAAGRHGLRLARRHDYILPAGAARTLFVFARASRSPEQVS
jgi:16S rRNA (guanine527-N7)-methyltransferase